MTDNYMCSVSCTIS